MGREVVIIGGGLGGLECGLILQRNGYNVTILERNAQPGGCLQSFSRGGLSFDTGFHYAGGLGVGEPLHTLFEYFGLTGLPWRQLDPDCADEIVIDGKSFPMATGYDRFVDRLAELFPSERESLLEYVAFLKGVGEGIFSAFVSGSVNPLFERSASEYLDSRFKDPLLRRVLCGPSLRLEMTPELPLYVFAQISNSFIQSSWRLPGGGSLIASKPAPVAAPAPTPVAAPAPVSTSAPATAQAPVTPLSAPVSNSNPALTTNPVSAPGQTVAPASNVSNETSMGGLDDAAAIKPSGSSAQPPVNPIIKPSGLGVTDPVLMPEKPAEPDPIEEELKAPMKAAEPALGSIGSAISGPADETKDVAQVSENIFADGAAKPASNVSFNDPANPTNNTANSKNNKKTLIALIAIAAIVAIALGVVLVMQLIPTGSPSPSGGSSSTQNNNNSNSNGSIYNSDDVVDDETDNVYDDEGVEESIIDVESDDGSTVVEGEEDTVINDSESNGTTVESTESVTEAL